MFSKSKINDPGPKAEADKSRAPDYGAKPSTDFTPSPPKTKPAASVLSSDLTITGNLRTTGDIQVEGTVEGDIRAHLLTVGESATIRGEIVADDIVVNGRVIGRVRGLKVRLTSSTRPSPSNPVPISRAQSSARMTRWPLAARPQSLPQRPRVPLRPPPNRQLPNRQQTASNNRSFGVKSKKKGQPRSAAPFHRVIHFCRRAVSGYLRVQISPAPGDRGARWHGPEPATR